MFRTLTLAATLATAMSLPVLAQQSTIAPAAGTAATATAPSTSAVAEVPADAAVLLTAEQAKGWVSKPIYSSDGENIGEVAAFARGSDDKVNEMHADIGGFLGLGETRVKLMPSEFKLSGDRVTVAMTAAQAKDLPRVN